MREMDSIKIVKMKLLEMKNIVHEIRANVINSRLELAEENVNKSEGKLIETMRWKNKEKLNGDKLFGSVALPKILIQVLNM